ncbi:MAG: DUF2066 domain-containing protein [Proteobacteria bacterium]|nr:DUF2066 domain-containing protein [Pseudomonadota bacterium]
MIQPRTLRRVSVLAGLLALCVTLSSGAVKADSVYTVRDIAVDSSAKSAAEARSVALANGQRQAFERLLQRLVLSADRVLVPVLETSQVADLVDGYIIEKELVSSTRYRASLIFDFNKIAVRKLLQQQKIRFAETRSNNVLLLPIFDAGNGASLWLEPADWRNAWLARPAHEGLVPLILPLGDVMDMAAIEPSQALAPSREALFSLAERYGTQEVVVASAYLELPDWPVEDDPDVDGGNVSDAGGDPSGDAAETDVASSPRVREPVEGAILQLTIHQVGAATPSPSTELLRGARGESREDLLARAVARVVAHIESGWKQANMLRFGHENEMRIVVPLESLSEWVETRRRLRELAVVASVDLAKLSRGQADVLLRYFGEKEQLMLGLAQSNLALNFESGGWVLPSEVTSGQSRPSEKNL